MSSNAANASALLTNDNKNHNLLNLTILHPSGKTVSAPATTTNTGTGYVIRFHIDTQSVVEPIINTKTTQINRWLKENGHPGFHDDDKDDKDKIIKKERNSKSKENEKGATSQSKKKGTATATATESEDRYESVFDRLKGTAKNNFSVPPFLFYLSYTIGDREVGVSDIMSFRDSSWVNYHDILITEEFLKSLYKNHVQIKLWQLAPARDIPFETEEEVKTARKLRRKRYQEGLKNLNPKAAGKHVANKKVVNDDKLKAYIAAQKAKAKPRQIGGPVANESAVDVDHKGNPITPEEPKPHHYMAIKVGLGQIANSRMQRNHKLKRAISLPKLSFQREINGNNPYDSIVSLENLTSNIAEYGAASTTAPFNPNDPKPLHNPATAKDPKRARVRSAPYMRCHRPTSGGSTYSRITKRQERWMHDPLKPHPHHYDSPENTMTLSSYHSSKTFSSNFMAQSMVASVLENGSSVHKSVIPSEQHTEKNYVPKLDTTTVKETSHFVSDVKETSHFVSDVKDTSHFVSGVKEAPHSVPDVTSPVKKEETPFVLEDTALKLEPNSYFSKRKSKYINPFMQHCTQKSSKLKPGQEDHIYLGSLVINTNPLFGGKLSVSIREKAIFDALREIDICVTIDKPLIPASILSKLQPIRLSIISAESMPNKKPFAVQQNIFEPVTCSFDLLGESLHTLNGKPQSSTVLFAEDFYIISAWIPEKDLFSTFLSPKSFVSIKIHDRDPKGSNKRSVYGEAAFCLDKFWDDLSHNGKVKLSSPIVSNSVEAIENTWTESGAFLKVELEMDVSLCRKLATTFKNQKHYLRYLVMSNEIESLKLFMIKLYHMVTGVFSQNEEGKVYVQAICLATREKGVAIVEIHGDQNGLFEKGFKTLLGEFKSFLKSHAAYVASTPSRPVNRESFVRFWNIPSSLQKRYVSLWKEIKEFSESMEIDRQLQKQVWDVLFLVLFQCSLKELSDQHAESLIVKTLGVENIGSYIELLPYIFKEVALKKVHIITRDKPGSPIKSTSNERGDTQTPTRNTIDSAIRDIKNERLRPKSITYSSGKPKSASPRKRGDSAVGVFNYSIQKLNSVSLQKKKMNELIVKDGKHVYAYGEKYLSQEYTS